MKIGIIGTGNMGRIIIEALVEGNAAAPSSMYITNRTISKALEIQNIYKDIIVLPNGSEVANKANLIFLCVKPRDMWECIKDILPAIKKEQCIVSITSPITVSQLESLLPCSVARIIPSITNRALAGVALFTFGGNCAPHWKYTLTEMFNHISQPVIIEEEITRVASDIVSCGPAFFTFLIRKFIEAAVAKTKINEELATDLTSKMLIGFGELLRKEYYTLATLQEKVCVKGGITGEGIKVLENELGEIFEHLFEATHAKFNEELKETRKQFSIQ